MESNLLVDIETAFWDVQPPREDELVAPWGYTDDPDFIETHFREKHWSELPDEFIWVSSWALLSLSNAAFHFFVAAYMCACIRQYENADLIPEYIASRVSPRDSSSRVKFEGLVSRFTKYQSEAMRDWLSYIVSKEEDLRELDTGNRLLKALQYWTWKAVEN